MPQGVESVVSSETSTRRRYGFFASCLRWKMLVSKAIAPKPTPSDRTTMPARAAVRRREFGGVVISGSAPGSVSDVSVAMRAADDVAGTARAHADEGVVDQLAVAVQAVAL